MVGYLLNGGLMIVYLFKLTFIVQHFILFDNFSVYGMGLVFSAGYAVLLIKSSFGPAIPKVSKQIEIIKICVYRVLCYNKYVISDPNGWV